ncbi:hypothetical protein SBA1_570010 [Candidatus Sulfotelmatobacter kueseliae]|uniref:Uncharacterized protein n=1 Tax=Candidatus Sulfotelmatobacter kueseliae TaxID=2042962 RepID=A0A2U3L068_9BACT|nr:hypothetical protein SBA1_570010 [Candidatus Sulfotelmatobacter kueseliae]
MKTNNFLASFRKFNAGFVSVPQMANGVGKAKLGLRPDHGRRLSVRNPPGGFQVLAAAISTLQLPGVNARTANPTHALGRLLRAILQGREQYPSQVQAVVTNP